jgi:hypothetical protein
MRNYLILAGIGVLAVGLAVFAMRPPDTAARARPATAADPATRPQPVAPAPRPSGPDRDVAGADAALPEPPPAPPGGPDGDPMIAQMRGTPQGQALTRTMAPWTQVSILLDGADYPDAPMLKREAEMLVADLKAWHDEPMRFNYPELEGRQLGLMAHIRQATRGDPDVERKLAVVEQALADARDAVENGEDLPPLPPPSHQYLGDE